MLVLVLVLVLLKYKRIESALKRELTASKKKRQCRVREERRKEGIKKGRNDTWTVPYVLDDWYRQLVPTNHASRTAMTNLHVGFAENDRLERT